MKTLVTTMSALFIGMAQQTAEATVEAVMYLDTEMPCLYYEMLSGTLVVRNNGDDDIKLMDRDTFAYFQLYWFPNMTEQETERYGEAERFSRSSIKKGFDSDVKNNRNLITLGKGESVELKFKNREIDGSDFLRHAHNRRITFAVELYLSPDTWIPVEVHPPIVLAYDVKAIPVTVKNAQWKSGDKWVSRVQTGDTNEFLFVSEGYDRYRLADLHPDDVVTHSNKVITITQKNGKVRTIPEADIPRISAERAEEKRKARQLETKN